MNGPLLSPSIIIGGSNDTKHEIRGVDDDDDENNNPIMNEKRNEENNVVHFHEEEEEEQQPPAETQESFTQHEMTQTGNELTQMGLFDDDDDDENCNGNDCHDDDDDANSRQPMIDPLTLPWGRLMPVGANEVLASKLPSSTGAVTAESSTNAPPSSLGGGGHNTNSSAAMSSSSSAAAITTSSLRPSTREAMEMLPRLPETRTITRSRSPSMDIHGGKSSSDNINNTTSQNEDGVTFLGLKNLIPSDRFNEYVLGRSVKVSVCVCVCVCFHGWTFPFFNELLC
jgi:hypothetical protein